MCGSISSFVLPIFILLLYHATLMKMFIKNKRFSDEVEVLKYKIKYIYIYIYITYREIYLFGDYYNCSYFFLFIFRTRHRGSRERHVHSGEVPCSTPGNQGKANDSHGSPVQQSWSVQFNYKK